MITITYKEKTYRWNNEENETPGTHLFPSTIEKLIKEGFLEEVKENKELDSLGPLGEDHHYQYVLEKLREELQRRIREQEFSTPYQEIKWELEEVLDFVNSLETPRFTPGQVNCVDSRTDEEKARDLELYRTAVTTCTSNVWTPTPGDLIEVSNDGEKWEERKFHHIGKSIASMDDRDWYQTQREGVEHGMNVTTIELWKYARPIEQVTIPEFASFMRDPDNRLDMFVIMSQIEYITHFLHSQFPNSKPK